MKYYKYPAELQALIKRPLADYLSLSNQVNLILDKVKAEGDPALRYFTEKFDKVVVQNLKVTENEIQKAVSLVPDSLKEAILQAKSNIDNFHDSQKDSMQIIETSPGIKCWRKSVAIDSVGLYIPAGNAPLFSTVLMLGIPAKIAGCREIILCSPPEKDGNINPVILFVAQLVGCTQIFKVGGAQAIAAMAYGTETIPKVFKIFGPGNQYVTAAKQMVSMQGTAIDLPAGPSELLVWADDSATPAYVAADLLSQAEHGTDSQVVLVSDSDITVKKVLNELKAQLKVLPTKSIAQQSLKMSFAVLLKSVDEILEFINKYAPEHLTLNIRDPEQRMDGIRNAGSVFLGNYTPESLGDYASGTNHTLPTNACANAYSGVSLDSFVRKITFQKASAKGLTNIAWAVERMAEAENLPAHKNAVSIRLNQINPV
jgi:histidinol dehydrogenase